MGVKTDVATSRRVGKKTPKRMVSLGVDVPLLLLIFFLLVFGSLMVYSASWDFSLTIYDSPTYIFTRQVKWIAVGILVAVLLTFIDYHFWQRIAVPAMLVTIAALAGVLIVSEIRLGAARSFSEGSYQPSELAKLVIIIYLAVWLYAKREHLGQVGFGLLPLASILGIVGGLIFLQPDLSAVITVIALGGLLFFLAGGDMRQIVLIVIVAVIVGWGVVRVSPTGSQRVAEYVVGIKNPTEASYHVRRSMEAFVKGGWVGVGIGKSDTKHTGLPVPPTDSIFAVVGEETGVLGSVVVVVLYGVMLWRGLLIARNAPDLLGALLASGLSIWLVMEAFINMAVIVGLLPFAGNALPFVSAGGSNMLVSMASVGILMNVARMSYRKGKEDNNIFGPVVDFRHRRRKRLARPGKTG